MDDPWKFVLIPEMNRINELAQPHVVKLQPYAPGKQPGEGGWIKLNTNELPYGPPPAVGEAIASEVDKLARYPNPVSRDLREALARFHGLSPAQVIVGNGSDDILNLLVRVFGGLGRTTLDTTPSYSLYPVLATISGGVIQSIPFGKAFNLPVEALAGSGAQLLFLTCPNAPTGVRFPLSQLEELSRRFTGILVIDEAYAEFAEESALALLKEFENVVITRTFSKAYGLAGLRVGYGMASAEVISLLDRVRDSYNVNRLSQAGAMAALASMDYYRAAIAEIKATRERVRSALDELGWLVYPSEANFLFGAPVGVDGCPGPKVAADLFSFLENRKILVRYFPKHPLTEAFLRISIGSPLEMERFIEEVTSWQKSV